MTLNWPRELGERTPEDDRDPGHKFKVGWNRANRDLRKLMDTRIDAEMWGLDTDAGGRDPGVVIRWTKDGQEFAIACDRYTEKTANARECFLWLRDTERTADRPVIHGGSSFAAAALPSGDPDREMVVGRQPAHEVLGVSRDAPPEVIRGAYRELVKKHHGDTGTDPDPKKLQRVTEAKEELLG